MTVIGILFKKRNVDDSGFPRTPDRPVEWLGTRVRYQRSVKTTIGACGPNSLGGSATLWTLAPHDYIIYCQARGLSGHTSSCSEFALSHFRATLEDWLPVRLVFCYSSTLDPGTI